MAETITHLTDEEAALIWSGDTSSIANLDTPAPPAEPQKPVVPPVDNSGDDDPNDTFSVDDDSLNGIFNDDSDDDDDDLEDQTTSQDDKPKKDDAPRRPGRKPVELVSLVNQLIEEEVLQGYEDPNDPEKFLEVKTIEDAKELIKANLQAKESTSEDAWWENKVKSFSPQVQLVLDYASKGGQDMGTFLSAIHRIEEVNELEVETEQGQEAVVRESLKSRGFDDEYINEQIEISKNLDKLKSTAEKFLPQLKQMEQERTARILQEEELRTQQARKASQNYLNTVKTTLDKDNINGIKLERSEKAKIFESLAAPKFTSLSGAKTNGFVKALEELQFGEKSNYEHFLNVVHYTVDPENFLTKLRESVKNEVVEETAKKLRSAKKSSPNVEQDFNTRTPKKNTIQRDTFKNPFA